MRSTPRRLRWLVAIALVGLLGLYPLLAPTPHRIDQAHADLIVQGMTKEQVEAIFGVPAGQYDWAEQDGLGIVWFDFDGDGWPDLLKIGSASCRGGMSVVRGALL